MLWRQVLVYSNATDFFASIQELTGDLNYSLRLVRGQEEIETLDPQYKPDVLLIDCNQDSPTKVRRLCLWAWEKYPGLQIGLAYRTQFPINELDNLRSKSSFLCVQYPYEIELVLGWLFEVAPVEILGSKLRLEHFNPVNISDIGSGDKFPFDLYHYMPANKKFLLFRRKNSGMTEQQVQKFTESEVRDLFVRKDEMSLLHAYLANRVKTVLNGKIPGTVRREQLRTEAISIFRAIFGATKSRMMDNRVALESCKRIAVQFLEQTSEKPEIYQKVVELIAQGQNNYNHAMNVSIFATLFAMAVGEQQLEVVTIGGLLHDIGLATVDKKLNEFDTDGLSDEDLEILRGHSEAAVMILKDKNILNKNNAIRTAILQHHEHLDGSGYPFGLKDTQIVPAARCIAIADEFDHLTTTQFGIRPLTPIEAIEEMIRANKEQLRFDPAMLEALQKMFQSPSTSVVAEEQVVALKKASGAAETSIVDNRRRRRIRPGIKY